MTSRVYNFDEEKPVDPILVAAVAAAKKAKFDQQAKKLADDEKRWLRKKRLANTKLKKLTRAKRALRKRRSAFEKTLKG